MGKLANTMARRPNFIEGTSVKSKPRLKLKVGKPIDVGAADTLLAEEGNYQVSVNEEKLPCCSAVTKVK